MPRAPHSRTPDQLLNESAAVRPPRSFGQLGEGPGHGRKFPRLYVCLLEGFQWRARTTQRSPSGPRMELGIRSKDARTVGGMDCMRPLTDATSTPIRRELVTTRKGIWISALICVRNGNPAISDPPASKPLANYFPLSAHDGCVSLSAQPPNSPTRRVVRIETPLLLPTPAPGTASPRIDRREPSGRRSRPTPTPPLKSAVFHRKRAENFAQV